MIGSTRLIWLRALRDLMYEHCLLLTSFPLATMCTSELRQIATRPSRFVASITNNSDVCMRTQSYSLESSPGVPCSPTSHYMCPGGRFIIGYTTRASLLRSCILCWDIAIGNDAETGRVLLPVTRYDMDPAWERSATQGLSVQSDHEHDRLVIVIHGYAGVA